MTYNNFLNKVKINLEFICKFILLIYICALYAFYEIRFFVEIIFIIIMSAYFITKRKPITKYTIWSFLFIFLCFISNFWSVDLQYSLLGTRAALEIAIIGNLLIAFLDKKEKLDFLIQCFILAGLVLVLKMLITVPISNWGSSRIGNIIYNANSIGLYLGFSTIFALYLAYTKKNKLRYYILMTIFILVIFATGSRKAFVVVLAGVSSLPLIKSNKISKRILILPISICILIIGYQLVMNVPTLYNIIGIRVEKFLNLFTGKGDIDASTRIRIDMIKTGAQHFLNKPLIGYGINTYTSFSGFDTYSHNNYLELLTGIGAIGCILYYSIYLYIISKLNKIKTNLISKLFILIILILGMIEVGLVSWQSEVYHIIIAAAFSCIKLYKTKEMNYVTI